MRSLTLAAALLLATPLFATDPAAAIAKAKSEMTASPAKALQALREATASASALVDLEQRSAALSTIHFYSALALTKLGDGNQAAAELRSFFLYRPGSKIAADAYPSEFIQLFDKVQKEQASRRASPASFDDAYPGYPPAVSSSVWPLNLWGASSEFVILGTAEEKDAWGRIAEQDDAARRAFVDAFWAARDPEPSTKMNEARIELLQRVAFADVAFTEAADRRGSLTDRGRVFVLLGPPTRVSIRPLSRREAPWSPRRTIDAGNAIEQWTYFREQLPKKLPHNEIVFKFISDGGSSVRQMQHDLMTDKALQDAPKILRRD